MSRFKETIALSLVAPLALAACGRGRGETPPPVPSPTSSPTVALSERPPSPLGSPSASKTVTTLAGPEAIRKGLQTAKAGDIFVLKQPVIGSIQRVGENYKATIDTQAPSERNPDVSAFVLNGTCIFDAFNDAGKLHAPILGNWKVAQPVDELTIDVTDPYPSQVIKTGVHAQKVKLEGKTYDCQ